MYAESMRLEPRLGGRVPRLLGPARGLRLRRRHPDRDGPAGRARQDHPRGVGARVPRRLGGLPARATRSAVPVTTQVTKETLADLLDEKLSRRAVKDIQSGDQGPRPLRQVGRAAAGAGRLRRPDRPPLRRGDEHRPPHADGELVIRTDAGADLCRWDQNWKMHVPMFVRDSDELYREIYPEARPPRGRLAGAARVLLPGLRPPAGDRSRTARLPGHARVPARHRGLLQRLAGKRDTGVGFAPWPKRTT